MVVGVLCIQRRTVCRPQCKCIGCVCTPYPRDGTQVHTRHTAPFGASDTPPRSPLYRVHTCTCSARTRLNRRCGIQHRMIHKTPNYSVDILCPRSRHHVHRCTRSACTCHRPTCTRCNRNRKNDRRRLDSFQRQTRSYTYNRPLHTSYPVTSDTRPRILDTAPRRAPYTLGSGNHSDTCTR